MKVIFFKCFWEILTDNPSLAVKILNDTPRLIIRPSWQRDVMRNRERYRKRDWQRIYEYLSEIIRDRERLRERLRERERKTKKRWIPFIHVLFLTVHESLSEGDKEIIRYREVKIWVVISSDTTTVTNKYIERKRDRQRKTMKIWIPFILIPFLPPDEALSEEIIRDRERSRERESEIDKERQRKYEYLSYWYRSSRQMKLCPMS